MHLTRYYKRLKLQRLKIAFFAVIVSLFFLPCFVKFERTGDNMFTLFLNGTKVGVVDNERVAREYLLSARKEANRHADSLNFLEAELTYEPKEVIWGRIDTKKTVINNMKDVLAHSKADLLKKAYEVKINDYIVNLGSTSEVEELLQAAVDKYDEEKKYTVSLIQSEKRELPVLTPLISLKDEMSGNDIEESVKSSAGFDSELSLMLESIEPEKELDFEDYELGLVSMGYGDEIEIAEVYINQNDLTDVELAVDEITRDEDSSEIYTVVSGDTLSGISLKVNIPMEELIAMNDKLEDQNSMIRPDDELVINVPKPKLAVVYSEEMYYEEDYDAEVEYIYNDDWYTSDIVVHQQPSAGHRRVVAVKTFENSKEISTDIIKEEVTYEPVAKVVEKGTKIPPTYIKPIYGGRLTSGFGKRNRPTKGASTYHKGIDWATPIGTTVMASSGGVVAKAGWGSGYGYVIYINHPDGRQTRYGHLSKVLVSAGQSVSQGQKIALSGNTGVSTGPHVHFEILIGGSQVNPLKYVGQ